MHIYCSLILYLFVSQLTKDGLRICGFRENSTPEHQKSSSTELPHIFSPEYQPTRLLLLGRLKWMEDFNRELLLLYLIISWNLVHYVHVVHYWEVRMLFNFSVLLIFTVNFWKQMEYGKYCFTILLTSN